MVNTQSKQQRNTPLAVITGDIHFNINTVDLAYDSTVMAITKANELNVPFVANGDTQDLKANLRAECVNAMIEAFKQCKITPYVNVANHDRINERARAHAINFLKPYAYVIETPTYIEELKSYIIPYDHDPLNLENYLKTLPEKSRLIMHQGVHGSNPGDYVQDKSAISKDLLVNFRTILSHYHTRQDIKCGPIKENQVGLASYIGNPYSLTFGEATDPVKGFRILYDDGTLGFIPTNLRRHYIFNVEMVNNNYQITGKYPLEDVTIKDLVWLKVTGTKEEINKIDKQKMLKSLELSKNNVKIDLISLDTTTIHNDMPQKNISQSDTIDGIINDLSNTTEEHKLRLKSLWRNLCE